MLFKASLTIAKWIRAQLQEKENLNLELYTMQETRPSKKGQKS